MLSVSDHSWWKPRDDVQSLRQGSCFSIPLCTSRPCSLLPGIMLPCPTGGSLHCFSLGAMAQFTVYLRQTLGTALWGVTADAGHSAVYTACRPGTGMALLSSHPSRTLSLPISSSVGTSLVVLTVDLVEEEWSCLFSSQ